MHASIAAPFRAALKLPSVVLVAFVATLVSGSAIPAYAVTTAPGAPTAVTATAGSAQATVNWTAPASNGGSAITSYTVVSNPGAISTTVTGSPTVPTTATVTGLNNGTTYTFTVTATNAVGSGPASSPSNAVTPSVAPNAPSAPTNVVGSPSDRSANLTWTAPADNGGAIIDSYVITTVETGATTTINAVNSSTPAPTSGTVTGLTNGTTYTFTVKAHNSAGFSPPSAASNAVTPNATPGAPTAVIASAGNQQATVSWTAPSNTGTPIDSYTVTSSPGNFSTTLFAPAGGGPVPTTTAFTGLTNGTSYTFTVTAHNSNGTGPASAPSNAVTPFTSPGTPTNLVAAPADRQVTLNWTAPNDNGARIDKYTIVTSPGGAVTTVNAPNTSTPAPTTATLTGLTNGTSYSFTVTAHNAAGNGPTSAPSSAVTPGPVPSAPTNVTATAGNAFATVSWTAANGNGSVVSSYTVTSSPGGIQATVSAANAGQAAPTTTVVNGLTNGVTYTFTVTARNATGSGPSSNPSNAVTPVGPSAAPTNVVATPGDHQVSLSWVAPNTGGARIDRYDVTTSPGGLVTSVNAPNNTSSAPTSTVITGLTNGTTYTFTVTAHTSAGSSPASTPSAGVTPFGLPGAPTNVVGTAGNGQVSLTWTPPNNNGARIDRYTITTSPGGTQTNVFAPDSVSPAPNNAIISGLTNGIAYTFTVTAHNAAGTGSASAKSGAVTPTNSPATGTHAVAADGEATVSWVPPSVPSGDSIQDFVVTASPGGLTKTVGSGTTSTVMFPLTNGTTYTFTVKTEFTSGSSSTSTPSNAVTPTFQTTISVPTGTTTINAGQSVAITGFLTRSDGAGVPGASVVVTQRTGASSAFAMVTTVPVAADGSWNVTLSPTMHSTYMFSFSGDTADDPDSSQAVILVRDVVTWLSPLSGTTMRHGVVSFTASIAGAGPGTRAALQYRRSDGTWHDLAYGFEGSNHRVAFSRSLATGHWILRVAVGRTPYDFGATSRAVSLHLN